MTTTRQARWARALLSGALLSIATAAPARAEEVTEEARRHFKAGVALLHDPDGARVEEAYREFKTAYSISPSPRMLGNLGYCAMKLERDEEAINAYTRYVAEASDLEPGERAQVESDILTLKSGLVHVVLFIDEPGATIVDKRIPARGDPITNVYGPATGKLPLGVRQGRHVFEVHYANGAPQTWEVDAMPGGKLERRFHPPPPPASKGAPVVPILVTVTGGLMLAGGAVTGAVAYSRAKKIEDACPDQVCPYGYGLAEERASAQRWVTVTDVLLVGGGTLAAAGLTWWILSPRGSSSPQTGGLTPRIGCAGSGCSAGLSGSF